MARVLRYATASAKALRLNDAHTFASAHTLSLYRAKAIYSFIPKNACSTMRLSVAIANGALRDGSEIAWIHSNNDTFRARLDELATADYAFAILRCPFARLASCYLDKIVGRQEPFWRLNRLMDFSLDPNEYTFRTFVMAMRNKKICKGDEHWRSQEDFLVYDSYDDLFDFADFAAARGRLKEKIGLEVHDARSFTRHGRDALSTTKRGGPDTAPLEFLVMRSRGKAPPLTALYDEELVEIVAEVYAGDVALMKTLAPASLMFSV